MLQKTQNTLISQLPKKPILKSLLLQLIDLYHKYVPFFIGNLTRIPTYLNHVSNSKVIARPGTLGFKGGAFNPGALILDENKILLLARAQVVPWFKARGINRKFYLEGNPVSFSIDKQSLKIKESFDIKNVIGIPKDGDYAIEDFRLFRWKNKIMINHSLITKGIIHGFINQKMVGSALSFFNEKEKTFQFCAIPKIDFSTQNFEKNWMFKEHGQNLLLFYSVNPYKVLVLEEETSFTFKTIINQQLSTKINDPGGFGTLVSLSTNPIDFDENHWLLIIHQIKHKFTGRCYYHWAVLINKLTFSPVKITFNPIFSGMGARGRTPGIRYISSILKVKEEILFFAGEGDVYVTVTKKTIKELEKLFVPL